MNIHQISVFLENRTGQLAEITRLLADNGIDIRAISIAETSDYGLARMIVDDSHKASEVLLKHGDILSMTPVWAVLAENHVDVEYMYSLFTHKEGMAYMVMRVSDEPRFLSTLGDRKIRIVGMEELGLK